MTYRNLLLCALLLLLTWPQSSMAQTSSDMIIVFDFVTPSSVPPELGPGLADNAEQILADVIAEKKSYYHLFPTTKLRQKVKESTQSGKIDDFISAKDLANALSASVVIFGEIKVIGKMHMVSLRSYNVSDGLVINNQHKYYREPINKLPQSDFFREMLIRAIDFHDYHDQYVESVKLHAGSGEGSALSIATDVDKMILIAEGPTLRGSRPADIAAVQEIFKGQVMDDSWFENESPAYMIYLDAFYIDKYEVTNIQYAKFIQETRRAPPQFFNDSKWNKPYQPVVGVSWNDAAAYAKWVGKRLPTEAEWEKAARGSDNRLFPWGNSWSSELCNTEQSGLKRSELVGSRAGNASYYGVFDMAGNVSEWCSDWYDESYYETSPRKNPKGPAKGRDKVLRGGSWLDGPLFARCAKRYRFGAQDAVSYIGFRCVKSVPVDPK